MLHVENLTKVYATAVSGGGIRNLGFDVAAGEFYTLLGTAAAALVALLFVAISVGAAVMTPERSSGTRTFISPVVFHYSNVLFLSLIALVPGQTPRTRMYAPPHLPLGPAARGQASQGRYLVRPREGGPRRRRARPARRGG